MDRISFIWTRKLNALQLQKRKPLKKKSFLIRLGRAVSDHFCNFPKLTIWYSHPLQRWEKNQGLNFSLFSFLIQRFLSFFTWTIKCNTMKVFQGRLPKKVCHYVSPPSLWRTAFQSAFKCSRSEQLKTLLISNVAGQHVKQTSSDWPLVRADILSTIIFLQHIYLCV